MTSLKSLFHIKPFFKGLVDIRHVIKELQPSVVASKNGAEHLAKEKLGIKLDFKDDWKFHEHWENENLDDNHIKYAANDVLTAMAVLLKGIDFLTFGLELGLFDKICLPLGKGSAY